MKNEKQAIRSWRLYDFLMECYRDSMLHSKFISKEYLAKYAKRTKLIEQKYQMALNEPTLFDI